MNAGVLYQEVKAEGDEVSGSLQPLGAYRSRTEGAGSVLDSVCTNPGCCLSPGARGILLPACAACVKTRVPITVAVRCDSGGPRRPGSPSWKNRQERAGGEARGSQKWGVCWRKQLCSCGEGGCTDGVRREKTCLASPGLTQRRCPSNSKASPSL